MNRQEAVSRALRTNEGKSPRSEDLGSYPDFFVDPINSTVLEGNANQLVYGRRGSGKTLMLGTVNERIQAAFPKSRVMSFCYTATDFRSSAEFDGQFPTVKEKTHAFFHAFIDRLCHDIFELADEIIGKVSWLESLKLAGTQNAAKRDRLVTVALELLEVSRYGTESALPGAVSTTRKESVTARESDKAALGFGVTVDPSALSPVSIRGSAELGRATDSTKEQHEETVFQFKRQFSPVRVRQLLIEIIEVLDLDCLVIFIDEWMSLSDCQVEFAERLRQCLFGDKRIGVKIAADQYQGQFDNSGQGHNFRGIEVGADIFVAVDLDQPFRDSGRTIDLFAEALYRRLYHFEPVLERFFGAPPLANQELFLDTVFASRQAFVELCAGAQGICRDFHLLFQECSKRINSDLTSGKIDFDTVQRVILASTEHTYKRVAHSIDSNTLLFRIIFPHIQSTGSRYFILESRPSGSKAVVNDLLTKRIIHPILSSSLHPSIRGEYDCFEIDYGIYIDLMRAAEFSTGEKFDQTYDASEVAAITSVNKATFLLDLSSLSDDDQEVARLLCPHCEEEFLASEKAYQIRRICPNCFLDQEGATA